MLRKYCAFALIILISSAMNDASIYAKRQDSAAEKIKTAVAKIGVGEKTRATVTKRDGTKLSGYITEASDADFTLTDKKQKLVSRSLTRTSLKPTARDFRLELT